MWPILYRGEIPIFRYEPFSTHPTNWPIGTKSVPKSQGRVLWITAFLPQIWQTVGCKSQDSEEVI